MYARLATLIALGTAVLFVGTSSVLLAGEEENADEARLRQLLQERVRVAEKAVESMSSAYESGTVTLDVLFEATNKLFRARMEAATTDAERFDALHERFSAMRRIEEKVHALWKSGSRGGEANAYYAAQRERLTAEIALRRAELKLAQQKQEQEQE